LSVGFYFRAGQSAITTTKPGLFSWNYKASVPLSDMLHAWDSGGPTFVEEPGGLALAGIHDAILGTTFFDTGVTRLVPAINAAVAAAGLNEQPWSTQPPHAGPSSLALVGRGLAAWYAVRQRNHSTGALDS
jgi:hypothetical protein